MKTTQEVERELGLRPGTLKSYSRYRRLSFVPKVRGSGKIASLYSDNQVELMREYLTLKKRIKKVWSKLKESHLK